MATQADFDRIGNYARMYNPDQNIDRRKQTRTVPLEVLCLGYSRTGTLTMHTALNILGYPNPYHFSSIYDNVRDSDAWLELIATKFDGTGKRTGLTKADFDAVLGHTGAVTDMPAIHFAAELIEFYPDAKIVLVERDLDSWYASWSAFLKEAMDPGLWMVARLDGAVLGRIAAVGGKCTQLLVGSATTLEAARARSKEEYRKHYALVRSLAPKERLLDFKLKDGWEPLCEFLGKPVPKEPFPHVNDSASNKQGFKELGGMAIKRILRKGAVVSVAVGVAAVLFYQFRRRA